MNTNRTLRKTGVAALIGVTAVALSLTNAIAQQDSKPASPTNPIAIDSGTWGPSSKIEKLSFDNPEHRFWPNFYDTAFLTNIETWHPQHVVRLSNKDGRAYFMVTQAREHNGYITVLRTDPGVLDPATDLIVLKNPGTPVGKYVWQDVYTGKFNGKINPVGNWNHPGKMDVVGGVLLVAAQNWNYGSQGTSIDKVLFYDVRDPEQPRYMGAIDRHELGVKEIATVGLVKTPNNGYLLCAGGDGTYATLSAREVSPNIKDWTRINPNDSSYSGQHVFSGQHGMNFNSYQKTTNISGSAAHGVERVMYFDASAEKNVFTFLDYQYDSTTQLLANTGEKRYAIDLPGANRDWDTSSLYVTQNGTPIIYTVKSGDWAPYVLYQVHQP